MIKLYEHFKQYNQVSESMKYHIDNNLSLTETIYRMGSEKYLDLYNEARELYNNGVINLNENDIFFVTQTNIGEKGIYEGEEVLLDLPFYEAQYHGKEVKLNSPFRINDGKKKFAVYVKNKKGNVVKIRFGQAGVKIKNDNPKASKSFRARHKCSLEKNRLSANYWACNVGRYAKQLKLKSNKPW